MKVSIFFMVISSCRIASATGPDWCIGRATFWRHVPSDSGERTNPGFGQFAREFVEFASPSIASFAERESAALPDSIMHERTIHQRCWLARSIRASFFELKKVRALDVIASRALAVT
jgi:hypothetical protein